MPGPIYHLMYVSTAVARLKPAELEALLAQSRPKNGLLDITGILIYGDGKFIQALEGPKGNVDALYRTIRRDPRHRGVTTLIAMENDSRDFPGWAMAYSEHRDAAAFGDLRKKLDDTLQARTDEPERSIHQLLQHFLSGEC